MSWRKHLSFSECIWPITVVTPNRRSPIVQMVKLSSWQDQQSSDLPVFCLLLAPSLSSTSTTTARRWTPFANAVPSDSSKASLFSKDATVPSKTTSQLNEPVGSFSSLTGAVKNAMQKGQLNVGSTSNRSMAYTGTTLSTKDLNHLSPQSM